MLIQCFNFKAARITGTPKQRRYFDIDSTFIQCFNFNGSRTTGTPKQR